MVLHQCHTWHALVGTWQYVYDFTNVNNLSVRISGHGFVQDVDYREWGHISSVYPFCWRYESKHRSNLLLTSSSEVPTGLSVIANAKLENNTTIVTCPFALAITEDFAQQSLLNFLNLADLTAKCWTERQWIASYLCFHWIINNSR